ncbi:MAG: GLUG motif-containing protein, partial [Bacillota bacterium]|nr:GLUG motif-containing protein [Bacillota bacterium]
MKKILLFILVASFAVLAGCDFYGTTTTTAPIEPETHTITLLAEFVAMNTTDHYVLGADIDLGGLEWIPLGTPDDPFSGDFDGAGHTVSNFAITHAYEGFLGLFGSVTGDIKDLTVTDFTIDATSTKLIYAGGLVAHTTGSIDHCTAVGEITVRSSASTVYVGLLAGFAASYTTSTMTLAEFVSSEIRDSRASGSIDAEAEHFLYVGGLIGKAYNIVIADASAVAAITASSEVYRVYAGGLVGHGYGGILKAHAESVEDAVFETVRCYADASITITASGTKAAVGGLYGFLQDGFVEDCFANATIVAAGSAIDVGSMFGELWYGPVATSVGRLDLTIIGSQDQTVRFGYLAGFVPDPVL